MIDNLIIEAKSQLMQNNVLDKKELHFETIGIENRIFEEINNNVFVHNHYRNMKHLNFSEEYISCQIIKMLCKQNKELEQRLLHEAETAPREKWCPICTEKYLTEKEKTCKVQNQ